VSTFDKEEARREIIVVKRGGGGEEHGHHGGVWKIAFADFMTAMMCFFLVMWLINATDEQTKASIASYFNPMTLVDRTPTEKGIEDSSEAPMPSATPATDSEETVEKPTSQNQRSGPGQHANSVDHADTEKTSDQHLFADPYAVLAEIAGETSTLQNVSAKGDGGAQTSGPASGAEGGESYRDPFAPDFWSKEIADPESTELAIFRETPGDEGQQEPAADAATPDVLVAEAQQPPTEVEQPTATPSEEPAEPQAGQALDAAAAPEEPVEEKAEQPAQTEKLAEEIRDEIDDAFGQNDELNQTISVVAQEDGILISVTDELNYGMFEIGSAVPQSELVRAMEKISAALTGHTGRVRINGHTDGRPFRNEAYDNWRLSTARAHAAYYMLVRGGLDEARVEQVAGFADRKLKITDNPLADANRRIEIFLETGG
jgi:chemotaxis protein MotB